MYSVCALVAAACLLAQTAHADDVQPKLLTLEKGQLPANYNKMKEVVFWKLRYINITQLFDLGHRKPKAVKLEIIDTNPPSVTLNIAIDLLSASVEEIKPLKPIYPSRVNVSIDDHN